MGTFEFPRLSHITYRLWRLRRLILAGALLPLTVFCLVMMIRWLVTGQPPSGVFLFGFLCLIVIGVHAVLFPNSSSETGMIAIALTVMVIAAPLAGNSVLGWLVLIVIAAIAAIFGQGRLLSWQMNTKKEATSLGASVKTRATPEQAMQTFAEQPDRDQKDRKSGPIDEDGKFPVYLHNNFPTVLNGMLDDFEEVEETVEAEEDEPFDLLAEDTTLLLSKTNVITETTPEADEFEENFLAPSSDEEPDELQLDAQVAAAPEPDYWVEILEQTPELQKARISLPTGLGDTSEHSIVEYKVTKTLRGSKVTETETLSAFEQGMSLGMWITDFQKDGLVMRRDRLDGREERALRTQHQDSLLTLIGRAFMQRMMRKRMEVE